MIILTNSGSVKKSDIDRLTLNSKQALIPNYVGFENMMIIPLLENQTHSESVLLSMSLFSQILLGRNNHFRFQMNYIGNHLSN